ncbi:MAG: DUF2065 domain-containing protein [Burkholderiaceae bacterium]|nr:DUF2065 domain-containing protein [Burkholderiaceae bacterium]
MSLFGLAIALMLVFEGLLPLVAPKKWREMFSRLGELTDGQLRFFGLIAVAAGALLFWLLS